MPPEPTTTAAPHEHEWRDTGFATVEDCECGATRSGEFITEPATAAPRSYVAEWLTGNESLVAERTHLLLDAVEVAITRHADVHPHRVADCEMCQFRGRVATAVLLNEPWEATDGT